MDAHHPGGRAIRSDSNLAYNVGRETIMRSRKKTTKQLIKVMVQRLVRQFDPEQIILFGSQARGDAGPDSDIDLLVVMPLKNPRREKRNLELAMRRTVFDIKFPNDIIVVTPEEVAWQKDIPGTIVRPALLEGKSVYVRQS